MDLKKYWLLVTAVALVGLTACEDNKEPDPVPEPDNSTAQLSEIIDGIWVSTGESGELWNMWMFDASDNKNSFTWLYAPDPDKSYKFNITSGEYSISNSPAVIRMETSSGDIVSYSVRNVHRNGFDLKMDKDKIQSCHRVIGLFSELSGSSFSVDLKSQVKELEIIDVSSKTPEIVRVDDSKGNFTVIGNGVGYVEIKTDAGSVYLVVVGSPLVELPYAFYDFIGVSVPKDQDPSLPDALGPLHDTYPGITKITAGGQEFTSLTKIEYVSVQFNEEVSPLAIWSMLNRNYEFSAFSKDTKRTLIYVFKTENSRSVNCRWTTNTNIITYY